MDLAKGPNYTYAAEVMVVHDGDTITCRVDLGFRLLKIDQFRLAGINAPELNAGGDKSKKWLTDQIMDKTVMLKVYKNPEKFGRWLADVYLDLSGKSMNQQMIDLGLAAAWDGKGPRPQPVEK